jgi:hypothetical protein
VVGDNKGDEESRLRAKRSLYGSPGLTIGSFRALSKVGGLPHDDMDDGDFACPFAVDDDEVDEYRSRIGSPVARPKTADTFESVGLPGSVGAQPHAAVGAFVRFLRSAPPLRELRTPSGTFSDLALGKLTSASRQVPVPTHTSPLTAVGSLGVAKVKGSPPNPGAAMMRNLSSTGRPGVEARFGSGSPFVSPGSGPGPALTVGSPPTSLAALSLGSRTAADALEELRGYREMRDFLMRQRGGNLASGQTAV